jgi:hypothetical protein
MAGWVGYEKPHEDLNRSSLSLSPYIVASMGHRSKFTLCSLPVPRIVYLGPDYSPFLATFWGYGRQHAAACYN